MASEKHHYQRFLFLMAIAFMMSVMQGCFFYKVSTSSYPRDEDVASVIIPGKTIIVHSGMLVFEIDSLIKESDTLTGKYVAYRALPLKRKKFPDVNSSQRYRKRGSEKYIYNEVHFYLQVPVVPGRDLTRFALGDIYRFDIYSKDKEKTAIFTSLPFGFAILLLLSDVFHTTGFGN